VHCDIYRSSYNISYVHPSVILLYSSLHFWDSFIRSYFSIFIRNYIVSPPYSPSYILSPHPPPSHWYLPQTGPSCSLFWKKDIFCLYKIAIQGVSLWHSVHMYYNPN
jgi:hypothetical protein